ncbi:MAG: hypothetical protein BIP78_0365 [Candidatus Bipolaricaulis sibiricus]|uniref:Uncharacterized protein n=1 Tax=Bipolaricaulis sibiricus TaxID=2501609 RepID=A0A410FT35_BIPS1|nr:MAG: hypothetical protein BIP78_0365 [Candidatus Bipolaricaulis sibiricus]
MTRRCLRPLLIAVLLGQLTLSLTGCTDRKTDPVRSGWSRGLPVATTNLRDAPAAAWTSAGRWVAWTSTAGDRARLTLTRVSPGGDVVVVPLDLGQESARAPRLVAAPDGLILFFLGSAATGRGTLLVQRLSHDGIPVGPSARLGQQGEGVSAYCVASADRTTLVAWASRESGVRITALGEDPAVADPGRPVAQSGDSPTLAVDEEGAAHLAWIYEPALGRREVLYARISSDLSQIEGPWVLGVATGGLGAIFSPPILLLDADWIYAFLTIEYRSGPKAGTTETYAFAAPRQNPELVRPFVVALPDLTPEGHACCLEGAPFGSVSTALAGNTSVRTLGGDPKARQHAVLLASAKLPVGRRVEFQPVLVFLHGGEVSGWSPIASTPDSAIAGVVIQSPEGWHAVWLDMRATNEYRVLYATTAPSEARRINRFDASDLAYVVVTILSGLLAGLAAIPLFLLAAIPGLLLTAGHYVFGGEGDLRSFTGKLLLGLSASVYSMTKLMFTAGMVPSLPFAIWLPPALARLLATAAPILFLAGGVGAVAVYWRRSDQPGLLPAYGLFVGTDLILSLLLVGPALAGA